MALAGRSFLHPRRQSRCRLLAQRFSSVCAGPPIADPQALEQNHVRIRISPDVEMPSE